MFFRFQLLIACVVLVRIASADEPSVETLLKPEVVAKELSGVLREGLHGRSLDFVCELAPHAFWNDSDASSTSVILVPGLFGNDDSMSQIQSALKRSRIPSATFRYADQRPIEQVAAGFAKVLRRLEKEQPQRSVCLVTHSLGGIVARVAIEPEGCSSCGVKRVIMIAPPNHGSALATLDASEISDYVESLGGERVDLSLINDSVDGFVGDARASLQPGSQLLAELNSRPRASGVAYTIIAGTGAPLQREWIELPLLVTDLLASDPGQRKAMAPLRKLLAMDELMRGFGDGVVSLKSARLAGVDDFATFAFAHNDFGAHVQSHQRRQVVDQVIRLVLKQAEPLSK